MGVGAPLIDAGVFFLLPLPPVVFLLERWREVKMEELGHPCSVKSLSDWCSRSEHMIKIEQIEQRSD